MNEIIKKFLDWRGDNDENYVYDQIHDFYSILSRNEMTSIITYIFKSKRLRYIEEKND